VVGPGRPTQSQPSGFNAAGITKIASENPAVVIGGAVLIGLLLSQRNKK